MTKLPKSLIKKYGISKKAWRIFKGRKTTKKVKARSVKTMAKRKRRRVKARSRRRSSGSVKLIQVDAMLYGAGRGFLNNLISPVTSMIPGGFMTDEIGLGIANYFIAKNTSGLIKRTATKGLAIENANFGQSLISGGLSLGGNGINNSNLFSGGY